MEKQLLVRFPFGAGSGVKIAGCFDSSWIGLYARRDCFADARAIEGLPQIGVVCMISESDGEIRGLKVVKTRDGLCGIEGADIKKEWTSVLAFCTDEVRMTRGSTAALAAKIVGLSDGFSAQSDLIDASSYREHDEARVVVRAFEEFLLILDTLGLRIAMKSEQKPGGMGLEAFSEELPSWALESSPDVKKVPGAQEAVRQMLKVAGISRRRLSMQMNRSSGFVDAILQRGTGGMKVETLLRVASALGFSLRLEGHSQSFEIEME